jgi:hypothetical protein
MDVELAFGTAVVVGSLVAVPVVLSRFGTSRRGIGLLALVGFWFAYGLVSLRGTLNYPSVLTDALFVGGGLSLVAGVAVIATDL